MPTKTAIGRFWNEAEYKKFGGLVELVDERKYGFPNMNESQQILFMQIRILRMLAEKYSLSLKQPAEIFGQYNALTFIREGFGIFMMKMTILFLMKLNHTCNQTENRILCYN